MAGDEDMQMNLPRRGKLEWNLNTIIQLITLFGMCIGGVTIWVDKSRDIEELQNWRTGHEQLHKERLAEVKAIEASYNQRILNAESKNNENERKIDNLTYRVTVAEQSAVTVTSSIKDLQSAFNKQSGDLQVMREILQRLETSLQSRRQ